MVSQMKDDNSAWEGNALKATMLHHIGTQAFLNPRASYKWSPKQGMMQCLERGIPE
jgi:hypothetical protein